MGPFTHFRPCKNGRSKIKSGFSFGGVGLKGIRALKTSLSSYCGESSKVVVSFSMTSLLRFIDEVFVERTKRGIEGMNSLYFPLNHHVYIYKRVSLYNR